MKRTFFIAGVKFRPQAEIREAAKEMKVGDTLTLEAEPTNKFDPNAVRILATVTNSSFKDASAFAFLGYVPKKFSSEVSGLLSIGAPVTCTVKTVDPNKSTWEMFEVEVGLPIDEETEPEEEEVEE
jgi:hypothetical protein